MNFVVIADLNDLANFHVGDEAMFEANLARLGELFPGANFTVLSQKPDFTARQYNVMALSYFGFSPIPGEVIQRENLLQEILEEAEKARPGSSKGKEAGLWQAIFESLQSCDALIVSGGGNISSTWPHHLYERVALVKIAALYGKSSIFTGQTLGPNFTPEDRALLKETLPLARLVGVREKASFELGRELGLPAPKLIYQLDDAAFYKSIPPRAVNDPALAKLLATSKPWLAITIHHFADFETGSGQRKLKAIAGQIRKISRETGTQPIFLSHAAVAPNSDILSDEAVGQKLARLLEPEIEMPVLGVRPAREVSWLTGQAALVISTRYHPLVFGLTAGVPSLGIYVDRYTEIKLQGALGHALLEDWLIPLEFTYTELFSALAVELWQKRQAITRHLETLQPQWEKAEKARLEKLKTALTKPSEDHTLIPEKTVPGTEVEPLVNFALEDLEENGNSIKPSSFLARMIAELDEENKTKNALFEEVTAQKDQYIASLLQELTTLRKMLAEKDMYNVDLLKTLGQKDTHIKDLMKTLGKKEIDIRDAQEALVRKDNYIKIMEKNLGQKDEYIKDLEETLGRKETYIKSLEVPLERKGNYVHNLRDTINQKDTYILSLRDALNQKDTYIRSLQEALAEKEANLKKYFNPA